MGPTLTVIASEGKHAEFSHSQMPFPEHRPAQAAEALSELSTQCNLY